MQILLTIQSLFQSTGFQENLEAGLVIFVLEILVVSIAFSAVSATIRHRLEERKWRPTRRHLLFVIRGDSNRISLLPMFITQALNDQKYDELARVAEDSIHTIGSLLAQLSIYGSCLSPNLTVEIARFADNAAFISSRLTSIVQWAGTQMPRNRLEDFRREYHKRNFPFLYADCIVQLILEERISELMQKNHKVKPVEWRARIVAERHDEIRDSCLKALGKLDFEQSALENVNRYWHEKTGSVLTQTSGPQ